MKKLYLLMMTLSTPLLILCFESEFFKKAEAQHNANVARMNAQMQSSSNNDTRSEKGFNKFWNCIRCCICCGCCGLIPKAEEFDK